MYPDTSSAAGTSATPKGKSESLAFYFLLATVILAPLAFWPSPYASLDLVKTLIIALGTFISAIFFGISVMKERTFALPPKSLFWTAILIVVSLIVSAATSIHFMKSFIGSGFEIGTASFIMAAFVAGLVSFSLVYRKTERAVVIYVAMASAYLILFIFQMLRFFIGNSFMNFSILNTVTASIIGSWSSFGFFSGLMTLISLTALMFLPLSRKMQIVYVVLAVLSAFAIFVVNVPGIWFVLALVFLGLTIWKTLAQPSSQSGFSGFLGRVAWLPLVIFVLSAILWSRQNVWSAPLLVSKNAQNSEISLPWQMTLDVTAGVVKNFPLFGFGPNHFQQAYLLFKPAGVNQGDGWAIEFATGFSLLATFIAAQGIVGTILWALFFVFFGVIGVRALRSLSSDPTERYITISSLAGSVFLWIVAALFVPSHAVFFFTLVLTGIFVAAAVSFGGAKVFALAPSMETRTYKLMPSLMVLLMIVAGLWGILYAKKAVALAYFGSGVKQLTTVGNPDLADADFTKALAFDTSDVYWQARAEAALSQATKLSQTVNAQSPASTTQAVLSQVVAKVNAAMGFAENAVNYDRSNYYNYVSQARVSEMGTNLRLNNAYDAAVSAYTNAISRNPNNPALYLSLSRLQATQGKYDDALRTVGYALQSKNNYLDGVFLLSQIDAAKGNLPEAITAAQFAIELNPNNPILYFQLGLLQYNAKNYSGAADAMSKAIKIQPDYANAQYFLGLSQARLGNTTDAVTQFAALSKTNPDNQEVQLILANLQAGKPIFADAVPPVTQAPEKRPNLPIKQK